MCLRSDGSGVFVNDATERVWGIQDHFETLAIRLSPERLGPYKKVGAIGTQRAITLYKWNVDISAEFYKCLSFVEVVLRNALSSEFSRFHAELGRAGSWLTDTEIVWSHQQRESVQGASDLLRRQGKEVSTSGLVPLLNFGFWRYLMTKRYLATYWSPVLCRVFPGVNEDESRPLIDRLGRLHHLRNRIAHHEPIFGRRLDLDHRDCLLVLGAICPVTARWVESQSRVPEVLAARPPL